MIKKLFLCVTLLLASAAVSAVSGQAPGWSRGIQSLAISLQDCKTRAKLALEAEGYTVEAQGGDPGDGYVAGAKAPHSAIVACDEAPGGKTWANVFVASSGTRNGDIPGAERVRLQARMNQAPTAQNTKWCWRWQVELKEGPRQIESMLTMTADGKARLDAWGISGTWSAVGNKYVFDWGRGPGKQDILTLNGNVLTGSNFETNWIRGELIACP